MIMIGRIYDIVEVNEKVATIILRKKMSGKIVPVAISLFGYWKDKALKELKLRPKDKIKGNIYIKSKQWNNKWYTDVYFKEIILVEPAPVKMNGAQELFTDDEGFSIDAGTGELIE